MLTSRRVATRWRPSLQTTRTPILITRQQSSRESSQLQDADNDSLDTEAVFNRATNNSVPFKIRKFGSDKQSFRRPVNDLGLDDNVRYMQTVPGDNRDATQKAADEFRAAAQQLPPREPITKTSRINEAELLEKHPIEGNVEMPSRSSQGASLDFSPLVLRDMCTCPKCIDPSSKQRLFSTFDIPETITLKSVETSDTAVSLTWENDIPGYIDHTTILPKSFLSALSTASSPVRVPKLPSRTLWDAKQFHTDNEDIPFEAYMHDDAALHLALHQLQTHGLLFLSNVPSSPDSVARISQRIGPLKNTFYGETWDVRSVPHAKNVAYTSQDLGFHMDLLYMAQPPHLQALHCIRSSAKGGASLFTDSFKAASDLYWEGDITAFEVLCGVDVTHHYNHLDAHFYQQSRPTIELADLRFGGLSFKDVAAMHTQARLDHSKSWVLQHFSPEDYIRGVSWAPPFQAPFRLNNSVQRPDADADPVSVLGLKVRRWHRAARLFNALIQRREGIYERMMQPGECVIFDNRRVLHARKGFEVGDEGSERWLRGAYVDWDPFSSRLRVLSERFGQVQEDAGARERKRVKAERAVKARRSHGRDGPVIRRHKVGSTPFYPGANPGR